VTQFNGSPQQVTVFSTAFALNLKVFVIREEKISKEKYTLFYNVQFEGFLTP